MEIKESKKSKKLSVSPEQIEKAADSMGKAAGAVDNVYSSFKDGMGSTGKAIGFAVLVTLVFAVIHSPFLLIVFGGLLALGSAPAINKKMLEFKAAAEARKVKQATAVVSVSVKTEEKKPAEDKKPV